MLRSYIVQKMGSNVIDRASTQLWGGLWREAKQAGGERSPLAPARRASHPSPKGKGSSRRFARSLATHYARRAWGAPFGSAGEAGGGAPLHSAQPRAAFPQSRRADGLAPGVRPAYVAPSRLAWRLLFVAALVGPWPLLGRVAEPVSPPGPLLAAAAASPQALRIAGQVAPVAPGSYPPAVERWRELAERAGAEEGVEPARETMGRQRQRFSIGSSASRSASPTKLKASSESESAAAGGMSRCG